MPKTLKEFEQEWGKQKYVDKFGKMTGWLINDIGIGNEPTFRQLEALQEADDDVFELFASYAYHNAGEGLKSEV